mmetsp:Transcript_124053/g.277272  ORF Transcript_124053/g.277272 Transcript_124053/m.277272 type:complete len:915 (-) Transcript_124053:185-2929(-)
MPDSDAAFRQSLLAANKALEILQGQGLALLAENNSLTEKVDALSGEVSVVDELKAEISDLRTKAAENESLRQKVDTMSAEALRIEEFVSEISVLRTKVSENTFEKTYLTEKAARQGSLVEELNFQISDLKTKALRFDDIESENCELRAKVECLAEQKDHFEAKSIRFMVNFDAANTENSELRANVEALTQEVDSLRAFAVFEILETAEAEQQQLAEERWFFGDEQKTQIELQAAAEAFSEAEAERLAAEQAVEAYAKEEAEAEAERAEQVAEAKTKAQALEAEEAKTEKERAKLAEAMAEIEERATRAAEAKAKAVAIREEIAKRATEVKAEAKAKVAETIQAGEERATLAEAGAEIEERGKWATEAKAASKVVQNKTARNAWEIEQEAKHGIEAKIRGERAGERAAEMVKRAVMARTVEDTTKKTLEEDHMATTAKAQAEAEMEHEEVTVAEAKTKQEEVKQDTANPIAMRKQKADEFKKDFIAKAKAGAQARRAQQAEAKAKVVVAGADEKDRAYKKAADKQSRALKPLSGVTISRWVGNPSFANQSVGRAKVRLILIYGAGGSAASYVHFQRLVQKEFPQIQLLVLELPGHGYHATENPADDIQSLIEQFEDQILTRSVGSQLFFDAPFALIGQSGGARFGFELIKLLQRHSMRPDKFYVVAAWPPVVPRDELTLVDRLPTNPRDFMYGIGSWILPSKPKFKEYIDSLPEAQVRKLMQLWQSDLNLAAQPVLPVPNKWVVAHPEGKLIKRKTNDSKLVQVTRKPGSVVYVKGAPVSFSFRGDKWLEIDSSRDEGKPGWFLVHGQMVGINEDLLVPAETEYNYDPENCIFQKTMVPFEVHYSTGDKVIDRLEAEPRDDGPPGTFQRKLTDWQRFTEQEVKFVKHEEYQHDEILVSEDVLREICHDLVRLLRI